MHLFGQWLSENWKKCLLTAAWVIVLFMFGWMLNAALYAWVGGG